MSKMEYIKEFGLELAATITVIAIVSLITKFRRLTIIKMAKFLLPGLTQSGLIMAYKSMKDAKTSIEASVNTTRELRILSNKGTDWFGGDDAMLSQVIAERSQQVKVRVLLLSKIAPWLAKWAEIKNVPPQVVRDEFDAAHKVIGAYFKKYSNKLSSGSNILYYRDNPVWRFLMTDDRLFISSYAKGKQARDATVFEFKGPDSEVYQAFERYFEFLCERRGLAADEITESLTRNVEYDSYEVSAGAVVYTKINNKCRILLIKRRKGRGSKGDYTLPKGHVGDKETFEDAVKREINEETGLPVNSLQVEKRLKNYPNTIIIEEKERVHKTVCYFLVRYMPESQHTPTLMTNVKASKNINSLVPQLKVDKKHHVSAEWCLVGEIDSKEYAYPHTKKVLQEAKRYLC
jgi:ADP-ribose pyrophosphatase YjhB (NUDIX family)